MTTALAPAPAAGASPVRRRTPVWLTRALPLLLLAVALAVRIPLYGATNSDYRNFLDPWYTYIAEHGHFAALRDQFANYNVPYLYLLAAVTYLPVPKLIAIKSISVVFDLLLAFFGYRIVALRFPGLKAAGAAAALLLAPTVVLNSSYWGQCDAIYAAFCLGSMYFLLRRAPVWAAVFFGLGLAFKLQAVFFLPVAVVILLLQRPAWRRLLLAAAVAVGTFVAMWIPALAVGASWRTLWAIYPAQISGGSDGAGLTAGRSSGGAAGGFTGGRGGAGGPTGGGSGAPAGGGTGTGTGGTDRGTFGGGQGGTGGGQTGGAGRTFGGGQGGGAGGGGGEAVNSLTRNAPSFYQWLPTGASTAWKYIGLALTALAVAGTAALAWVRRRTSTGVAPMMLLASASLIAIPFLLPGMHERYFYLADVFTIVTCFYVKRFWPVALLVQLCSLAAYAPFLFNTTIVPLGVAAAGELVAAVVAVTMFVRLTRSPQPLPA